MRNGLTSHWKETYIVMEHGPTKSQTIRQLYILGEYAYRGSSPIRIGLPDYEVLPEAVSIHISFAMGVFYHRGYFRQAKDYIYDTARSMRNRGIGGIKSEKQLVASLGSPGGVVVHKITLEVVRPRKVLEHQVAVEAHRRGLLQST